MTTTTEARRGAGVALGLAAALLVSGCAAAGADGRGACAVDEEALAERIADRVYDKLRQDGYVPGDGSAPAGSVETGAETAGGAQERTAEGVLIRPRDVVDVIRGRLQGTPTSERGLEEGP